TIININSKNYVHRVQTSAFHTRLCVTGRIDYFRPLRTVRLLPKQRIQPKNGAGGPYMRAPPICSRFSHLFCITLWDKKRLGRGDERQHSPPVLPRASLDDAGGRCADHGRLFTGKKAGVAEEAKRQRVDFLYYRVDSHLIPHSLACLAGRSCRMTVNQNKSYENR